MPKQKTSTYITYSDSEIKALIIKDMIEKRLYDSEQDNIINMRNLERQDGSIPRGQFDEDPIYVFAGLEMVIETGVN